MAGNTAEGTCLGRGGRWEDDVMWVACCKAGGSTGSGAGWAGRARAGSCGWDGLISGKNCVPTALPMVKDGWRSSASSQARRWVWCPSALGVLAVLSEGGYLLPQTWGGRWLLSPPLSFSFTQPCALPPLLLFSRGCLSRLHWRGHILWSWQPGSVPALPSPIPIPKQRSLVRQECVMDWWEGGH